MQNAVDEPDGGPPPAREKPIFAARLIPHRSLSRKGFILLMLFVGATCFASGILFLSMGAWPVFGFFGLDALLIWGAFKLNYRSARAFEEIAVWQDAIEFRQVSPAGRAQTHRLNPFWTRFVVERHEEFGIMRMALREKGREFDIGSFLNPPDRASFAAAFDAALSRARQ